MNKIISLFVFFFLLSPNLKSQDKKSISLNYGLIKSELIRTTSLAGGGGFSNKNSYELGFRFYQPMSNRISIESGFDYFRTNVEISNDFPGVGIREEILSLITIPIVINFSLNQNYYLSSGFLLNFQYSETSFDKQSGIGFSIGLGRKFLFEKVYLLLNPKIDINSVLPFSKENYHQRLIELGLQIGIGYEF